MSLTIRRLLLATSAIVGFINAGAVIKAEPMAPPEPRGNFWSGGRRWRRTPKQYHYHGPREERRAGLRLAFKAANGRWP